MTNDELLAGFLDRSLSEDQLLEFEARREADGEFAQQARTMIRVERVIPMAVPVILIPTDFLHAVETSVASKVAGGAAAASGVFSGVASSTWGWIAGASAVAITAGSVYVATRNVEPVESVPVVAPVAVHQNMVPAEQPTVPVVKAPVHEAPVQRTAPIREEPAPTATAINSDQSVAPVRSFSPAPVVDMQTESADPALESLISDLEACRGSGDHVRCAQIGLALGRTYRERGNMQKAELHLGQALADSRKARTVQYEVDILGEMAINAQQSGRTYDAHEYLLKAVSIGKGAGIDVSDWKKMLDSQE